MNPYRRAIPTTKTLSILAITALAGLAIGQTVVLNLNTAIQQAFSTGPDLASSVATLKNAQADLAAKEADPSTLIVPLTQARNTAVLNTVQLRAKQIEVTGSLTTAYLNLFEAQENNAILTAQIALDVRNLEIAKAKLEARNGTALDVAKAESTLAASRQNLTDAKANLPILSKRLEVYLGSVSPEPLTVSEPPAFREIKFELSTLEKDLELRLPSVLQVAQSLQIAELNVKLADNDYTPPATLRDTKTTLENARRSLETTRSNALTQLRDANRSVLNALENVKIAQQNLENAKSSLSQDQTKLTTGTISRVQLQQTELSALRSQYSYTQALDSYWRALTTLSNASGIDVIGLVPAN